MIMGPTDTSTLRATLAITMPTRTAGTPTTHRTDARHGGGAGIAAAAL
jgi:hypothetical protein